MSWSVIIEIAWADRKLRKTCADDRCGQKAWGADHWKLLKRRLLSLAAAPTLRDLEGVPGNVHQLRADRRGQFAMSLWGSQRIIFVPDQDPVPRLPDGGIDRGRVTRVKILEVVDYHGR